MISRTSARQYKETAKRLPEIGNELHVDGVVEGTLVRSEAGVRITATLIRAGTDRHVWAQTYDGDVSHMLALQQRIASDVAVAAGWPPSQAARGRSHAVNARAYELYLQGLTASGLQRSDAPGARSWLVAS